MEEKQQIMLVEDLKNEDGIITVSSRLIAQRFGKRHDHVLRDIENITKDGLTQNWGDLFILSQYQNEQNKQWYKEYLMTRDGFTLLAMGFTGKEALKFKLEYINAFNYMENQLKNLTPKLTKRDELCLSIINSKDSSEMSTNIKYLIEHTEEQIRELEVKPLEEQVGTLLETDNSISMGDYAKILDIGRNTLFSYLRNLEILDSNNIPYQKYMKYFEVIDTVKDKRVYPTTRVTGLGQDFIYKKLKKENLK